MNIDLQIDELVLHGFPAKHGHGIGDAVRHELTRVLSENGVPRSLAASGDVTRLDGGTFVVPREATQMTIGTQIAQAVYGGLET